MAEVASTALVESESAYLSAVNFLKFKSELKKETDAGRLALLLSIETMNKNRAGFLKAIQDRLTDLNNG